MKTRRTLLIGLAAAGIATAAGGAVAFAGGDGEGGVTGPDADRAVSAALDATHGGRANQVERDSEHGATWEVEVTTSDGTTVDVRLDANFEVLGIDGDSEAHDTGDHEG